MLLLCTVLVSILPLSSIADIQVRDDSGQTVQLSHPASRIISLAPHLTELVFAVGAGDKLLAVSRYSDYPLAAKQLPIVANAHQLDIERILSLKPDLILAWQSGNPPAALAKLASFGLPIFYSEPQSIADIASSLERLGRLTGKQHTASLQVKKFTQHYQQLRQQFQHAMPRRIFLQLWDDPLITVNRNNLLSKALTLCGDDNVFATLPSSTATVSAEAVITAKPDIILHLGGSSSWKKFWLPWQTQLATKPHLLVTFDDDRLSRFGPRFLDGVQHLCHTLAQTQQVAS